jgi:hypothetical protein
LSSIKVETTVLASPTAEYTLFFSIEPQMDACCIRRIRRSRRVINSSKGAILVGKGRLGASQASLKIEGGLRVRVW